MIGNRRHTDLYVIVPLFIVLSFVLFYPVLDNGFLSDDYDSLYRIYIQKQILYKGILRPMIDVSFLFNFLISGLSPKSYYVFNILLHAANGMLIFRLAHTIQLFEDKRQYSFAFFSALLFLVYPFHTESISWLTGRISSMAVFFALITLLLGGGSQSKIAVALSVLCFWLGLLCYESIIVLPGILYLFYWNRLNTNSKKKRIFLITWSLATVIYLLVRFFVSGSVYEGYGTKMVENGLLKKIGNAGKVFGRVFLPPSDNQYLMLALTALVFAVLVFLHGYLLKKKLFSKQPGTQYFKILGSAVLCLLLPVLFGISTRTTEGDRLLYFPSIFICMAVSALLFAICKSNQLRAALIVLVLLYSGWWLEKNNLQWENASRTAEAVLKIAREKDTGKVFFINLPDEIEGAFVFRNGFAKSLTIYKIDPHKIEVVNWLRRPAYLKGETVIVPSRRDSIMWIYPSTKIIALPGGNLQVEGENYSNPKTINTKQDRAYFWNKNQLVKLF